MTTLARLRKGALALPEVEEGKHGAMVAFTVRSRTIAARLKDRQRVEFPVPADRIDALLDELPGAEPVLNDGEPAWVRLVLADLDVRVLDRLLLQAWEMVAPAEIVAARHPHSPTRPPPDLPPIGRPATAALTLFGVTSLEKVATYTAAELLDLHGVGPRAIRILEEALAAEGRSFKD
jgi:hypothetical protein